MDQRTRMFRVWICLAVSMTGGSTLLTWLEPDAAPLQDGRRTDDFVRAARVAVSEHEAPAQTWTGVSLLPWPRGGADGIMLAAVRRPADVHFLIESDGRIHPQTCWREQRTVDDAQQIRVALATAGDDQALSRLQSLGVRALIDALRAEVTERLPAATFSVTVDDAQGVLPAAGAMRSLLAGVPLPG